MNILKVVLVGPEVTECYNVLTDKLATSLKYVFTNLVYLIVFSIFIIVAKGM